ncbi:MAG: outer membrane protein transport protein [Deferribacteres bacterium]|nr:outer membrane protein transport protein [candidate division KSB1 bacterium]MCB9502316.1 outer membrane protein transport protein [Deferribacteres bacterium]
MKNNLKRLFIGSMLAAGLLTYNNSVQAGGFNLYEFGGRASALAGAIVAQSADASTVFYNPAGVAFLDNSQFYGGVTLIFPTANFVGVSPMFDNTVHDAVQNIFTPVGIYYAHKLNDKVGFGIGLTNPFGLGLEWEDDFPGRAISRNALVESYYISPVVAYKVTPNFSIGVGADLVIAKIDLIRNINVFDSEGSPGYDVGEVELSGSSDLSYGFSFSAQYQAEKWSVGFMYRNGITNEFKDGDAAFAFHDDLTVPQAAAVAGALLQDQHVSTTLDFPGFFSVGASYQAMEKLRVEMDYMWFQWSVFDQLQLDFENESTPDQTIPFDYEDSWQLRLGGEYALNEKLDLRAGYIFDKTPQPIESVSPLLPDDDRHDISVGIGYKTGRYVIDAGYMFVNIGERSTVENGVGMNHNGFNGTYNSRADLFWASFGVNF